MMTIPVGSFVGSLLSPKQERSLRAVWGVGKLHRNLVAALTFMVVIGAGYSTSVTAQEAAAGPAEWRAVDAETGTISNVAGLEQLARDFPHSGSVRLRLVNAHAAAGDLDGLYEAVRWLTARGYAFSDGAEAQIAGMFEGERAERLVAVFAADTGAIEASELELVVPADVKLAEGLTFNPASRKFSVTSVVSRGVWLGNARQESFYSFGQNLNLSGIVSAGRVSWFTSGDLGMVPDGTDGFNGIVRAEMHLVRYPAPEGATLSDLFVTPDIRSAYASDPLGGGVYHITAEGDFIREEQIQTLIPPGTFRSPQGLVTSADDTTLYISDYRYGLAMIDLATRDVTRLDAEEPILLDGIDALLRHGDELIAVQNGTSPMRIIALKLSADGKRITSHRILERAHPEWTEPLGATISGDTLYYIGNGQWHLYDEGGALKEGAQPQPTQIRAIKLGETG